MPKFYKGDVYKVGKTTLECQGTKTRVSSPTSSTKYISTTAAQKNYSKR